MRIADQEELEVITDCAILHLDSDAMAARPQAIPCLYSSRPGIEEEVTNITGTQLCSIKAAARWITLDAVQGVGSNVKSTVLLHPEKISGLLIGAPECFDRGLVPQNHLGILIFGHDADGDNNTFIGHIPDDASYFPRFPDRDDWAVCFSEDGSMCIVTSSDPEAQAVFSEEILPSVMHVKKPMPFAPLTPKP